MTSADSIALFDSLEKVEQATIYIDSIAIGNIRMGCSEKEYKKAESEFLRNHRKLGRLTIDRIEPLFVDGNLAEISIYSNQYEIPQPIGNTEYGGWEKLYAEKYRKNDNGEFVKGFIRIEVSDVGGGIIDMLEDIKNKRKTDIRSKKTRAIIRIFDPRLIEIHQQRVKIKREENKQKELDVI